MQQDRRLWAVALLWLALAAVWVLQLGATAKDDFFITYRYASNLAAGHGLVFNPGERVMGSTEPGLGLLLAALHVVTWIPIPWLGVLLTAGGLLAACLLLLVEGRDVERLPEMALGGTLALAGSFLWSNAGGAWPVVLALVLLAARLAERRPAWGGLVVGFAVWCRPDALGAVLVLVVLLAGERRRVPWRFALAAGGTVLTGAMAAWWWFGRVIPNTLAAKAAMGEADGAGGTGLQFWPRAADFFPRHLGPGWAWLVLAGGLGLALALRAGGRAGRLLVLFAAGVAVAYPLLGVPFFAWYIAPCIFALAFGVGWLLVGLARGVRFLAPGWRFAPVASALLAVGLGAVLLAGAARASWSWGRQFDGYGQLKTYQRAAAWLREHSRPEDRVAYVEIGVLGFYSERPILDLMGLVSPEVLPFVRRNDLLGAFRAHPTEIVVFHSRGRMAPVVSSPWFQKRYEVVATLADEGTDTRIDLGPGRGVTIYRRKRDFPLTVDTISPPADSL